MNRIKLYALAAVIGISASVLPVAIVSKSFTPSVGSSQSEAVEALPTAVFYGDAVHVTNDFPDDNAVLPSLSSGDFYLSSAADKLTPPAQFANAYDNTEFVYFRQNSPEYNDIPYGNRTIGSYGCGPTNMAVVITSLTGRFVSPITLAKQAEEWGCFVSGSGTSHAFFPKAATYYGLKYEQLTYDKQTVISYLKQSKMIICTMGAGHFTRGGHYVTLRGITADGKILIADTYSEENTYKEWSLDFLASQLKYSILWVFENP